LPRPKNDLFIKAHPHDFLWLHKHPLHGLAVLALRLARCAKRLMDASIGVAGRVDTFLFRRVAAQHVGHFLSRLVAIHGGNLNECRVVKPCCLARLAPLRL